MKGASESRPRRSLMSLLRDDRGVSAIEFAIAAPAVLILILGTVEIALDMFVDASVQLAAQAASRTGLTTSNPSTGTRAQAIQNIVTAYLGRWQSIGGTVNVTTLSYSTYSSISAGNSVTGLGGLGDVVSYNVSVTMPGFSGIPKLFGLNTLTFQRNFIVQNEK
jgi:Flp pilus assembly protein TadG